MKNKKTGNFGELLATLYLKLKGYEILERNFSVRGGEIDIIASKKNEISIIEVKTRRNLNYGEPRDAVDFKKREKIIYTAKCYLNLRRKEDMKVRFDVIEIILSQFKINHIKDAFFQDDV